MDINKNPNYKVKDLTIAELRHIISEIVRETMEGILEDREALSSKNYIDSIKEAREDYKNGKFTNLEDIA